MAYTFECGSCHAIYKLDQSQITLKGVKITCPKCLSYFILKKGLDSESPTDSAYIEYVMEDGIHPMETTKRPIPKPPGSQFDVNAKTQRIPTIPTSHIRKNQEPKIKSMRIEASKPPYPTLKKKKNKAIPYLLVTFIIIAAIVLLYWKVL